MSTAKRHGEYWEHAEYAELVDRARRGETARRSLSRFHARRRLSSHASLDARPGRPDRPQQPGTRPARRASRHPQLRLGDAAGRARPRQGRAPLDARGRRAAAPRLAWWGSPRRARRLDRRQRARRRPPAHPARHRRVAGRGRRPARLPQERAGRPALPPGQAQRRHDGARAPRRRAARPDGPAHRGDVHARRRRTRGATSCWHRCHPTHLPASCGPSPAASPEAAAAAARDQKPGSTRVLCGLRESPAVSAARRSGLRMGARRAAASDMHGW